MKCELCRKWFHIHCEGISEKRYRLYQQLIEEEEEDEGVDAEGSQNHWFCKSLGCNRSVTKHIQSWDEFTKEITERVGKLESGNRYLEDNIGQIVEVIIEKKWNEWSEEQEEKRKREKNLIFHKVREPNTSLTSQGKKEADIKEVLKIAQKIQVDLEERDMKNVFRIGKVPENRDYNRLLCVVFADKEKKWEFLSKSKYLKENVEGEQENEYLSEVFIVPDLTRLEREERKKLREELLRRRQEGESDLMIRGGRIIKKAIRVQ